MFGKRRVKLSYIRFCLDLCCVNYGLNWSALLYPNFSVDLTFCVLLVFHSYFTRRSFILILLHIAHLTTNCEVLVLITARETLHLTLKHKSVSCCLSVHLLHFGFCFLLNNLLEGSHYLVWGI